MRFSLILLLFAAACSGQVFEAGGFGGSVRYSSRNIGSIGSSVPGEPDVPVTLGDSWLFGLRMTLNSWEHFGQEFTYTYNRTKVRINDSEAATDQGTAIHNYGYSLLAYATPEGSRIRPFATGGGNFSNFIVPGGSVTSGGGDTKFGFHYGGGVKARISSMFLIRFDFKQYVTGKPWDIPGADGLLRRNEFSAGLSFVI
jgi:opacity protein-like surface antigen